MLNAILTIFLVLAFTTLSVYADEPSITAATKDADATVAQMMKDQEQDVRDYVKMFMGHISCNYDFPEEQTFNDIADQSIKNMAIKTKAFLQNRDHDYFNTMNNAQQDYVAHMVTQMVLGKWSTEISNNLELRIAANPDYCEQERASDHAIYQRLAAKILGE